MNLKDKVALVTGGGSGIGRAIGRKLASQGMKVAIADNNQQNIDQVLNEIKIQGGKAMGVLMDVGKEKDVENGIEHVIQNYRYLDVVVSNAGIQRLGRIENLNFFDWKAIMESHLDGSFLVTKSSLKRMYPSGRGGTIIYTGSVHSKIASVAKGPYTAAKHALIGLCKAVAKEGAAFGVRSNVICPGFVRTPGLEKQIKLQGQINGISPEEIHKTMLKDTVDGEFTAVDDIARIALFFASFPSMALTGQSLLACHGWIME